MQKQFSLFVLGLLLTSLAACVSEPDFPDEPVIEYIGVSKTVVNQADTVKLTFSFTDGDGDLGKPLVNNSSCENFCTYEGDTSCYVDPYFACFIIDERDSCYGALTLPDLEPTGSIKAISGEIDIVVPPIFCKCGSNPCPTSQDVIFKVVVVDQAGNYSNFVNSEPITVMCN